MAPFSISQWQRQRLDMNPRPYDDEATVLPPCHWRWPVPVAKFQPLFLASIKIIIFRLILEFIIRLRWPEL
jgi:hypothetical protein